MSALPQPDLELIRLHGTQLERSMAEIVSAHESELAALKRERDELRMALAAIVARLDGFDLNFCLSENNETNELLAQARAILERTKST